MAVQDQLYTEIYLGDIDMVIFMFSFLIKIYFWKNKMEWFPNIMDHKYYFLHCIMLTDICPESQNLSA